MALTPGLYVPQGQVGTGSAYVHEIKDRSDYLDTIAKANEKKRLSEERQIAKLKGFDYGKVTDQTMKEHISQKYKEGLETFSKIVAAGGEIDNISTDEGIQYTTWQNQIKDEADTAALAESKIIDFQKQVLAGAKDFDTDLYYAVLDNYENAKTPDEKLAATLDADPLLLKTFDFTKWIKEEIEPAKTDKEITDLGEDITKYQEVYNKKLDEVPKILASKRGVGLAKIAWKMYHDRGDEGFQQASFDDYVKEAIDSQRKIRESKTESPAPKSNVFNINTGGATPSKATVVDVPAVDVVKINIDVAKAAQEGSLFNYESDNPKIPNVVIKGKGNRPEDYGLSSDYAYPDPSDRNAIIMPADQLHRLESNHVTATSIQPDDKFATAFAGKTFTDENGNATKGSPSKILEDQLGNTWLVLVDEKGGQKKVILRVGGLMQTYTNNKGENQQHPFVGVAAQNQQAIEKALGVNFTDFMKEYGPKSSLR
jgi:hypothetical protein